MSRHFYRAFAFIAAIWILTPYSAVADPLHGIWLTSEGRSKVEVKPCEEKICANVIWLKQPLGSDGGPIRDRRNEAVELRDREIMGILVMRVRPAGQNQWTGVVYSPDRGKTYPADVRLSQEGFLQVTGCGGPFNAICKTQVWQKLGELGSVNAATN